MDSLGGREPCSAAQCSVTVRGGERPRPSERWTETGERHRGLRRRHRVPSPLLFCLHPQRFFHIPQRARGEGRRRRKGAGAGGRARNETIGRNRTRLAMSRSNYGRWAVFSCPRLITGGEKERGRKEERGEMGDETGSQHNLRCL